MWSPTPNKDSPSAWISAGAFAHGQTGGHLGLGATAACAGAAPLPCWMKFGGLLRMAWKEPPGDSEFVTVSKRLSRVGTRGLERSRS